jgi:hypothetical protein
MQVARGRGIQIPLAVNVLVCIVVTLFYAVYTEISIVTCRPLNAANNFFPSAWLQLVMTGRLGISTHIGHSTLLS